MIPLRDENPTSTTPVVVIALLIINFLVFFIDTMSGGAARGGALAGLAMVPQNIINAATGQPPIPQYAHPSLEPAWLTIFTSMFMHANLLHILGNMLYLWIFGNNIEDALGHVKFALFYFAGGFAAALAHVLSTAGNPQAALVPTLGASGAIAAVLGAYLVLYPRARVICLVTLGIMWTTAAIPALFVLGFWILLEVVRVSVIGGHAGGGVAYWAHIGGFITGAALIVAMGGRGLTQRRGSSDYYRPYR